MKPWHNEAVAMRKDGAHPKEIAHKLGMSVDAVRWVLNENGERKKTRLRARKSRGRRAGADYVRARQTKHDAVKHRPIIEPVREDNSRKAAISALAVQFAAGAINRQEFNRLLACQYPPRSAPSGAGERG